jgi:hypothetical protein
LSGKSLLVPVRLDGEAMTMRERELPQADRLAAGGRPGKGTRRPPHPSSYSSPHFDFQPRIRTVKPPFTVLRPAFASLLFSFSFGNMF